MELQSAGRASFVMRGIESSGGLRLGDNGPQNPEQPTTTDVAAERGGSQTTKVAPKKVKSVKICGGGAIDRIQFEYTDGKKWSLGGPGGNKGIPPLVLAADEYIESVSHESLPQWWYVGSSIELVTNKGRKFRHCASWGSGEKEDMVTIHARPGKCILSLRIVDGVLVGIEEGECDVEEGIELEMFLVYWVEDGACSGTVLKDVTCPKGHTMREDWSRAGHICDECSRRGTMARCGGGCDYDLCAVCFRHHAEGWASVVHRRGFASREGALHFAARRGASAPGLLVLGPLRVELEDHPMLDGLRESCAGLGRWVSRCRALLGQAISGSRASAARRMVAPQGNDELLLEEGQAQLGSDTRGAAAGTGAAGLVVDVKRGTRVKAWGAKERLAMCEKAAADGGEFNMSKWERRSSSLHGWVQWARRTLPLIFKVVSLLDWRRNVRGSLIVGLCIVVRSVADGWQPVLTGAVFNLVNGDKHEVERESHFLYHLCSWSFGCTGRLPLAKSVIFGLMLASVIEGVAKAVGSGVKKVMRAQQSTEMRMKMFEHLLAQDQALYDTLRRGELVNKAEQKAMDQVTDWVWSITADLVKLGTQFVFLFAISPVMTLAYTLLLPFLERVTRRQLEKGLRSQQRKEDGMHWTMHAVVSEAVSMIRTVKTFSREDRHVGLVGVAARHVAGTDAGVSRIETTAGIADGGPSILKWGPGMRRRIRSGMVSVFKDTSQRAVYCFCLWCGLVWMERDFSAGDMTAYLLLVQQVGGMVDRVRGHIHELQRRHDMLQDHFEFMDRTPQVFSGTYDEDVSGHVEFRKVEFSYPARPDTIVLKGVSFEMLKGEMTALVGASGSGKSTVAALIFRHYDPNAGAVLIDGVNLRDWDTKALHSRMALVAQQPLLFDTSVRNNLTYGCRHPVSDEEVEEASRLANAHEFVSKFPAGYDTYVGDEGAHISGGQKQRLSIARAIILRPQILVLDEATSALDAEAEGIVQDALDTVMVGRTTLVIAHRLSTIKTASQIVCMRDGVVVERGSPKALLAKQGYYWSLVRRQVCTLDDLSGFNLELDQNVVPHAGNSCQRDEPCAEKQDDMPAQGSLDAVPDVGPEPNSSTIGRPAIGGVVAAASDEKLAPKATSSTASPEHSAEEPLQEATEVSEEEQKDQEEGQQREAHPPAEMIDGTSEGMLL